ncbi:MAG: 16S rRNA (guanine(966)-N(2))-methyltransferase RsmD [Pseudomonadota bacterium]
MANNRKPGRVRIIGGQWRGRLLEVARVDGLRPTTDRIRETLFNWLQPSLHSMRVLDLFAGTGALGFEALSRGAGELVLFERDRAAAAALRRSAELLGANATVHHCDARARLAQSNDGAGFDLVFVDPPFADNDMAQLCTLLDTNHWLTADAIVYLEQARHNASSAPAPFVVQREKQVGDVCFALYGRDQERG